MRWTGHVARMEATKSSFKILTDKFTRKRLLGRPRHRWEENNRMRLKEMDVNTRNWIDSIQDIDYWEALVNAALNLRIP